MGRPGRPGADAGYRLERGECGGANGRTNFVTRTVTVRDDVDEAQAVKTLVHELAHVRLHDPAEAHHHRGVAEAEAESVAYAEVDGYVSAFVDQLDERGRRLVTRNGHAEARTVTTAAGGIKIEAPRVNDRRVDDETGKRCRFRSAIVPPWCRKSPKVTEVLPLMYLHGMSSGDFAPALEEFFGSAAG